MLFVFIIIYINIYLYILAYCSNFIFPYHFMRILQQIFIHSSSFIEYFCYIIFLKKW